jgi:hypothetical protein
LASSWQGLLVHERALDKMTVLAVSGCCTQDTVMDYRFMLLFNSKNAHITGL